MNYRPGPPQTALPAARPIDLSAPRLLLPPPPRAALHGANVPWVTTLLSLGLGAFMALFTYGIAGSGRHPPTEETRQIIALLAGLVMTTFGVLLFVPSALRAQRILTRGTIVVGQVVRCTVTRTSQGKHGQRYVHASRCDVSVTDPQRGISQMVPVDIRGIVQEQTLVTLAIADEGVCMVAFFHREQHYWVAWSPYKIVSAR